MSTGRPRGGTVIQGGRPKAYRPLPAADRAAALEDGLAAYGRGDYFEAHELLEPAWMGTDDPAERNLHQGLIKVAAAWVHATRGNPLGMAKNLEGARARLAAVGPARPTVGGDIDVVPLLRAVEASLAAVRAALPGMPSIQPPTIPRRRS